VGAPQKLVRGHAKALRHNVVQGDIDSGYRRRQHPAALEVLAAVHLLPQRPNPPGFLVYQSVIESRNNLCRSDSSAGRGDSFVTRCWGRVPAASRPTSSGV
jgi:hypothetical protein